MLSLEGIFYEIEENEIWSFNYNIMEGVISLSLVNPYTAQRHEMKIEKIYNIFFVHCVATGTIRRRMHFNASRRTGDFLLY